MSQEQNNGRRIKLLVSSLLAVPCIFMLAACGGGGMASSSDPVVSPPSVPTPQAATPSITIETLASGASIVKLATSTNGASIYYTLDGSAPTLASQKYEAPFLVGRNLTVQAIAVAAGLANSPMTSHSFSPNIASGTLLWSDEFTNVGSTPLVPDRNIWGYDTGNWGFGNHELENYCDPTSNQAPCDSTNPNAYVGTDGFLHVVARQASAGTYTSARLKSQGLFSFQYGRFEVRAKVPEAQGFWPAVWTLGNSISSVSWPASGEQDILERVNAATTPDWNSGAIHGPGFTGVNLGTRYNFPAGESASDWHTYGMIWKPGSVAFYVDNANAPYATFTTSDVAALPGSVWPFDNGQSNFILINLAVGGDWPGPPNPSTPFPSEMVVDYVRIYAN